MIEIIFTCWLIFMADGSAYCYCEGETPPEPTEAVLVVDDARVPKFELPPEM